MLKDYHDNGQLKGEAGIKNGEFEGTVKYYYENGQLAWEVNFKNGKKMELLMNITKTVS